MHTVTVCVAMCAVLFCLFLLMFLPPSFQAHGCFMLMSHPFYSPVCQATGEAAGEDVDSDSDSDDDDDDVRVTIGDIKTGAPQYT